MTRFTITHYETDAELELIKNFKTDLKTLQKDIKKEPNKISIPYTKKNQKELLNIFKTLYNNIADDDKSINSVISILNKVINKVK